MYARERVCDGERGGERAVCVCVREREIVCGVSGVGVYQLTASLMDLPCINPEKKPPQNASPAPLVSTTLMPDGTGNSSTLSGVATIVESDPCVTNYPCQKSPTHMVQETYSYGKRDLFPARYVCMYAYIYIYEFS